ncbi:hypothetical protein H4R34_003016 [Dimargaris verticillata]|uniref:Uncharacterized protein n=1 Tax=Dimargaris verticillata TaxID=2761393 RepID=A0A9W8B2X2_9FUNG|nr:hypothetical protein H4R34_003016 [Dimargaris verticillata]
MVAASPTIAIPSATNLFRRAPHNEKSTLSRGELSQAAPGIPIPTYDEDIPRRSALGRLASTATGSLRQLFHHRAVPSTDAQNSPDVVTQITELLPSLWKTKLDQGLFYTPQDIDWMKKIQSYVERVKSEPFAIAAKPACLDILRNDIVKMENNVDPRLYNSLRVGALLALLKLELAGTPEGLAFVRLDSEVSEAYAHHQTEINGVVRLVVHAIKQLALPSMEAQITAFHTFMEKSVFYQTMQQTAPMKTKVEALFQSASAPMPSDFVDALYIYEQAFFDKVWHMEG